MNHRELFHLLKNVCQRLTCPHCKARLHKRNINVLNVIEKDCVFHVACPQCKANLFLGAHMEKQPENEELVSNVSTRIQYNKQRPEITRQEMECLSKTLESIPGTFGGVIKK